MQRVTNLGNLNFYGLADVNRPALDASSKMLTLKPHEVDILYNLLNSRHESVVERDHEPDEVSSPGLDCLFGFVQHHEDAPEVKGRIFVPKDAFIDLFVQVSDEFASAVIRQARRAASFSTAASRASGGAFLEQHDILSRVYAVMVHVIKRDFTLVLQQSAHWEPKS